MAVTAINLALGLIFFININIIGRSNGALQVGFYKGKCNSADVENVIFQVVKTQFIKDSTIAAALLRMQFHDCWINVRNSLSNISGCPFTFLCFFKLGLIIILLTSLMILTFLYVS